MPTMDNPILPGTAATDYERYLRTDDLLKLQKEPEQRSHPDELLFQVVHQSSELLMKAAANEYERARGHMEKGELESAGRLLRRANKIMERPLAIMALLDTLSPYDYHVIRAGLGHGSGLDSPGFLALLHLAPRVGESFFVQVERGGITLQQLYKRHTEFPQLHELAECLTDFDQLIQQFRYNHLKLAQRIIGGEVMGTTGRPVDILRDRMKHPLYKQLWEVRNAITEDVNSKRAEETTGHGEQPRY